MLELVVLTVLVAGRAAGDSADAAQAPAPAASAAPSRTRTKEREDALEEAEKAQEYLEKRARKVAKLDQNEIEEFLDEVEEYRKEHRDARQKLPNLKDRAEPEDVTAYAKLLADKIREERKGARQGDIFTPRLAQIFGRIFKAELSKQGPERKVVLTEGNPLGDEERLQAPRVVINGQYIPAAPLSTVPPTLLLQLPPLPEELEYRFVGRTLILRDSIANLIVDFIPNAVP
jgi:hypothetical protein